MRKIIFLFFMMIIMSYGISYAYSNDFEHMIKVLELPLENNNGLALNEEIYDEYNLIAYGNPLLIKNKQRWKATENGKWTYNGSSWNGNGIRGEYWILGENAVGKEVHNELFPDDYTSGISPLDWNYIEISDAEESWLDIETYHSKLQREYMLKQKWWRKGNLYDITAETIGLNKVRVESFATWKTAGNIYTENLREDGVRFAATFNIPPMAVNAEIKSKLTFHNGTSYKISKEDNNIIIPISYGALIENLSEYVTKDDIKNIQSELLIDDIRVKNIIGNESLDIEDTFLLNIDKRNYENQKIIEILVRCNSVAETYFSSDIPMCSSKEEIILINVEREEQIIEVEDTNRRFKSGDKPKITSIEIKRVSSDSRGKEKYVDLNIAKKTNSEFICAGQVLYIRIGTINDASNVTLEIEGDSSITTFDKLTEKFEWTEPKERGIKTRYINLSALKKMYSMPLRLSLEEDMGNGIKYFSTIYVIPYETKQTLKSWSSIREEMRNAFEIDENMLFERIKEPYSLVFKAKSEIGVTTRRKKIDIFEAWNKIYNRDLSKYIK